MTESPLQAGGQPKEVGIRATVVATKKAATTRLEDHTAPRTWKSRRLVASTNTGDWSVGLSFTLGDFTSAPHRCASPRNVIGWPLGTANHRSPGSCASQRDAGISEVGCAGVPSAS